MPHAGLGPLGAGAPRLGPNTGAERLAVRAVAERLEREPGDLGGLTQGVGSHTRTVLQDGQRRVPHSELERAGLLPGAELHELRRAIDRLTEELTGTRQLVTNTERAQLAEQQARERVEAAFQEQRAAATVAEQRAAAATDEASNALDELRALEDELRAAGPIRAWKLARSRRRAQEPV